MVVTQDCALAKLAILTCYYIIC